MSTYYSEVEELRRENNGLKEDMELFIKRAKERDEHEERRWQEGTIDGVLAADRSRLRDLERELSEARTANTVLERKLDERTLMGAEQLKTELERELKEARAENATNKQLISELEGDSFSKLELERELTEERAVKARLERDFQDVKAKKEELERKIKETADETVHHRIIQLEQKLEAANLEREAANRKLKEAQETISGQRTAIIAEEMVLKDEEVAIEKKRKELKHEQSLRSWLVFGGAILGAILLFLFLIMRQI